MDRGTGQSSYSLISTQDLKNPLPTSQLRDAGEELVIFYLLSLALKIPAKFFIPVKSMGPAVVPGPGPPLTLVKLKHNVTIRLLRLESAHFMLTFLSNHLKKRLPMSQLHFRSSPEKDNVQFDPEKKTMNVFLVQNNVNQEPTRSEMRPYYL